jgi:hypothetical protein
MKKTGLKHLPVDKKKKLEFSKILLIQESALIWIMTIAFIVLAFYCISREYLGELPWLSAMVALPWTAYGVSQGFYYNKAKAENTKDGIVYETALRDQEESQG